MKFRSKTGEVFENEGTNCTPVKEEANMEKPRICEVLGVAVGERFAMYNDETIPLYTEAYISEDGIVRTRDGIPMDNMLLCQIINGEFYITRKPRWTEQEVEDAKTIKRVFGRDGTIERHSKTMTVPYSTLTFDHLYISENLFPSLHPDESVTLDEIIGGKGDGA